MPIHKKPAADKYTNSKYDKKVAHIRVCLEHCMGALKGRWQCLRGLRVEINSDEDHIKACQWVTICIILHNLIIDVEGSDAASTFTRLHGQAQEHEDGQDPQFQDLYDGQDDSESAWLDGAGEAKRQRLVDDLMAWRKSRTL